MSKKPGIPSFTMDTASMFKALQAVKTNVETLTGVRGEPVRQLGNDATSDEIIDKINEIVARLNARGK